MSVLPQSGAGLMAGASAIALFILTLAAPSAAGCGLLLASIMFCDGLDTARRAKEGRPASKEGDMAMRGLIMGPVALMGLFCGLFAFLAAGLASLLLLNALASIGTTKPETA